MLNIYVNISKHFHIHREGELDKHCLHFFLIVCVPFHFNTCSNPSEKAVVSE